MKYFNCFLRFTMALFLGFLTFGFGGALAAGAISLIPKTGAGVLMEGVCPEVWTGEMVKKFRHADTATFMNEITDYSQYVEAGNVIHLINIGVDPEVLINNTTYPITSQKLDDGDISITLDKYQTRPTVVTDDEFYSIKYDKINNVIERHRAVISEKKYDKSIHAMSPSKHTEKTPVIQTNGDATEDFTRLCFTRANIIRLKKAFDKAKIPTDGRILVLCNDHISDLLLLDQKFADQYYNYTSGKIANLYGFKIYEYVNNPYFRNDQKVVFNSAVTDGDFQASVAFYAPRMFKAGGVTKMYYSEAATNPAMQENIVNFRHYFITLPKTQEGIGAIVSAKAIPSAATISGTDIKLVSNYAKLTVTPTLDEYKIEVHKTTRLIVENKSADKATLIGGITCAANKTTVIQFDFTGWSEITEA